MVTLRRAREIFVDEAFVVAQIEIGLGAVFGDENFTMLIGRHRARVDIEIGIELHDGHADAAALDQPADRSRRDAFADR